MATAILPLDLDKLIEDNHEKTAGEIADLLWTKSHRDWVVIRPLVAAQISMALDSRRHDIETIAFREGPLKARKGLGYQSDRVAQVRAAVDALLDTRIVCGGIRTTWRAATIEQMRTRIESLCSRKVSYVATIDKTIARLELAVANVCSVPGAGCLGDLSPEQMTCFDGIGVMELDEESAA